MRYIVNNTANGFIVTDQNGKDCGGPYDAEHKAKRRIRDLKAKEAATTPTPAIIDRETPVAVRMQELITDDTLNHSWGESGSYSRHPAPINSFPPRYANHRPMGGARTR